MAQILPVLRATTDGFVEGRLGAMRDLVIAVLLRVRLWGRRLRRRWLNGSSSRKGVLDGDEYHNEKGRRRRGAAVLQEREHGLVENVIAGVLYVVALLVRVWDIAYPPSVVFDEVHFLRFVRAYYDGTYFFDIHPPFGKLVLWVVTVLFCGQPTLKYELNGEEFGEQKYVPLRWTNALFGSAVAPLAFVICREMGMTTAAALVPGVAFVFEHLAVVESRLVLLEGQLMFWMALCLWCALKLWAAKKGTRKRMMYLIATALSGAAAIGVKWTALATPALVALVSLLGRPFPRQGRLQWREMGIAGGIAVLFYVALFWVHFAMLPKSGRGDAFMTDEFQRTLIGGRQYKEGYRGPSFINNFLYLNWRMFAANAHIKTRHRWESKWYQWIINQRGLLYFNEADEFDRNKWRKIYLIVNPAVTFASIVALAAFLGIVAVAYGRRRATVGVKMQAFAARGTFFFIGYVVNILPYIEVARCTFLYHYLPPLFYALLGAANVVDVIPSRRYQFIASGIFAAALFVTFCIWSPWIYATPTHRDGHRWRQIYPKGWA